MNLHGIDIPQTALAAMCRRHGIRRLWLFGSILRPDFRADSDIDVLVEDDAESPAGLLALAGLKLDLEDLFGREVHLTTLGAVPGPVRPELLRHARLQYAA